MGRRQSEGLWLRLLVIGGGLFLLGGFATYALYPALSTEQPIKRWQLKTNIPPTAWEVNGNRRAFTLAGGVLLGMAGVVVLLNMEWRQRKAQRFRENTGGWESGAYKVFDDE